MSLARLVASGFGSGLAPWAPGSVASLFALVAGAAILSLGRGALILAIAIAIVTAVWSIRVATRGDGPGRPDPRWVVIDEIVGQWVALLGLPHPAALGLAVAFALFRLLDIAKPGPVGWAERLPGATGIIADDVVAGAIAACLLAAGNVALGRIGG
jgi:phosphatidylglycerophosphatase A